MEDLPGRGSASIYFQECFSFLLLSELVKFSRPVYSVLNIFQDVEGVPDTGNWGFFLEFPGRGSASIY